VFPKRNSLDPSALQTLEDPEAFAQKIQAGKSFTLTTDFMIIARLESLIAGTGVQDALERAERYIRAGVDGIMIHSGQREPKDLFAFAEAYQALCTRLGRRPPLVSVPTTYNQYSEDELVNRGFNIIIHANHLLRAAHKAMKETAHHILETGSSAGVDPVCSPVLEILSAVGFDRINAGDRERNRALQVPIIIPAAGKDTVFSRGPKSLITVAGRHILDYQLEEIRKAGIKQVIIIRGYQGEQFASHYSSDQNIAFCDNPLYDERHALHSLVQAREHMGQGFILVFSDILFDRAIVERLLRSGKDIVLGCDNSYTYHSHAIDKRLDLVVSRKSFDTRYRSLRPASVIELVRIGKGLELAGADYEFIGMAYFSQEGARIFLEVYDDLARNSQGPFHEASSFEQASVTDGLQEIIDRGYSMHGLEVSKGWMEIHGLEDVKIAEYELSSFSVRS
jgi:phosphoenolpyruvate phosphomutase